MSLGMTVTCVVPYCYVNVVVMATEVELYFYLYGKDLFYHSNKEMHLLCCLSRCIELAIGVFLFWSTYRCDKS